MPQDLQQQYLIQVELNNPTSAERASYPFNLPALQDLNELALHPRVTFFVGENGSGKSTLMEAIAVAYGFNAEGGSRNLSFETLATHSELHDSLRLSRGPVRPKDGYFLRAESFYNVATALDQLGRKPAGKAPLRRGMRGASLHHQSHGESFLSLMTERFGGHGLYLLDEPEAALSPQRQMAFLVRLHDLVALQSQFIIATHSPIVLSYPDAWIYQFGSQGIERIEYEQSEVYQISKLFLDDREAMLKRLLNEKKN